MRSVHDGIGLKLRLAFESKVSSRMAARYRYDSGTELELELESIRAEDGGLWSKVFLISQGRGYRVTPPVKLLWRGVSEFGICYP